LVLDVAGNHDGGQRAHRAIVFAGPAPGAALLIDRQVFSAAYGLDEINNLRRAISGAGRAFDILGLADAAGSVYDGPADLYGAFLGYRYGAYSPGWTDEGALNAVDPAVSPLV
jgi:hypothetical protein